MDTGRLIRQHRERADLSQEQLARSLNVSEKTLRRWESGEHDVPSRAVLRIAQALGVSVADLYPPEVPA